MLDDLEDGKTVVESLKQINLKDVIYWLAESWDDVKESTVLKSWKNISPKSDNTNDDEENEDDVELVDLLNQLPVTEAVTNQDVNNWMNYDEQLNYPKRPL